MAVFNAAKREIDLKIVYYGPAMCGKTTNVQCIHKMLAPQQRGELMSLATKDDRTLFFDFLPIELGDVRGFKTRFHIYTVPGQVYYALTRRAVLTGADGIVFVVDSQPNKLQENIESLKDLSENLRFYKKDLTAFPFVMQYNKRDLPNVMPTDELNAMLNTLHVPALESSAVTGMGVVETLTTICKIVLKQMDSGTAKKKPLQPSARPLSRPGMQSDDSGIRILEQQPAASPPARQAETVTLQPPKPAPPASAAETIPVADATPARPPLRMQTPETPQPDFSDINPLQAKKTAEFSQKTGVPLTSPGLSRVADSFDKEKSFEEDFSDLMIDESAAVSDEPELSFEDDNALELDFEESAMELSEPELTFDDDAGTGLDFEEPAMELSEPELTFDDDADTGLDFEEPAMELTEPELTFDDDADTGLDFEEPAMELTEPELSFDEDASELMFEEPAAAFQEAPPFEEDASGLMLDEEEPAPDLSADARSSTLQEPPSFKFQEPSYILEETPAFDSSLLKPSQKGTPAQIKIISCGQPRKMSDSVVKLPLTLKLKDDAEFSVSVTITIENTPLDKLT